MELTQYIEVSWLIQLFRMVVYLVIGFLQSEIMNLAYWLLGLYWTGRLYKILAL